MSRHFACALLVLFYSAILASAAPIELKVLTQKDIRDRVWDTKILEYDDIKKWLDPLKDQIKVDANQIVYTSKNGIPTLFEWRYALLNDDLDASRKKHVEEALRIAIENVFGEKGMLVSPESAKILIERFRVVAQKNAKQPEPPKKDYDPSPIPYAGTPCPSPCGMVYAPFSTVYLPPLLKCDCGSSSWQMLSPCGHSFHHSGVQWKSSCSVWPFAPAVIAWTPTVPYTYVYAYSSTPVWPSHVVALPLVSTATTFTQVSEAKPNLELLNRMRQATSAMVIAEAKLAYADQKWSDAVNLFELALENDSRSASLWYFKAAAEYQQDRTADAAASARRGKALEMAYKISDSEIARSLEKVQGKPRYFLMDAPYPRSIADAREVAAQPVRKLVPSPLNDPSSLAGR